MLSGTCHFLCMIGALISPFGVLTSMSMLALVLSLDFTCTRTGTRPSFQSKLLSTANVSIAKFEPRFAGWWGHDPTTRFAMPPKFSPIEGAQGFQQSNPSVLASASLFGSLQIFKEAGMMQPLRERSVQLTAALEKLLMQSKYFVPVDVAPTRQSDKPAFTIITPTDPNSRGAQLSLLFLPSGVMQSIHDTLSSLGVIGDERKPDVLRLAPAPLFNTLKDCEQGALLLERALDNLA
jgi:kynureninase